MVIINRTISPSEQPPAMNTENTEVDLGKEHATEDGINWGTATAMALFHVGAIAAIFFFTWKAFFVAMFLWWVSGSLGIGMSYHRLLTHRGYRTPSGWNTFSPGVRRWRSKAARFSGSRPIAFITNSQTSTAIRIPPATANGGRTWDGF